MRRGALAVVVAGMVGFTLSADAMASAPSLVQAPEIWGASMVGEEVRARAGRWRSETPLDWAYEWQRCNSVGASCVAIEEPGGPRSDQLPLTEDDIGHRIRVNVTATNASGATEEVSAVTDVVADTDAPVPDAGPAIETWPARNVTLVPGVTVHANGEASRWYPWLGPTVAYQWQRCSTMGDDCADVEGATEFDYVLTGADEGRTLRVEVSSTNRGGSARAVSDATEVVHELEAPVLASALPAPPVFPLGTYWEGLTLFADSGEWGAYSGALSQPGSFEGRTFQWLRCDEEGDECVEIEGATGSQYRPVQADDGAALRVAVTAVNDAGEATERSAATDPIQAPLAPVVEMQPFAVDHVYTEIPVEARYGSNVSAGDVDASYQWSRCDEEGAECEAISGATGNNYTPDAADLGHTLRVEVTLENRIDSDHDTSEASPVVEVPPTPGAREPPVVTPDPFGSPTLLEDPVVGEPLVADDEGIWSPDMDSAFDREWQWQRCLANGTECKDIPGSWSRGSRAYTPRWADVGYTLRVRIARFAGHGQAWATSPVTTVVQPGAPRNLALPSIDGPVRVGDLVTTDHGSWDPASPSLEIQWLLCDEAGLECGEIAFADSSAYQPARADLGATLRVRVTATDDAGWTTVTSAPSDPVGAASAPENVELPYIVGSAEVGEVLEGWEGTWHGARPIEYAPQWLRCDASGDECDPIAGGGEWWYEVGSADVGSTLRFEATASNSVGSDDARSDASAVVPAPDPPASTEAPSVGGTAAVGETLDADRGEWSNNPDDYAYQWRACDDEGAECEDVAGATDDSFHVRRADEGGTLRVVVTATNAGGEAEATSDPTDVVDPMHAPVSVEPPSLYEWAREGWDFAPEEGTWSGGTPMTFTYQWLLCDEEGESCEDISGADDRIYVPVAGDVGRRLKVRVRATNDAGYVDVTSSPSFPVERGAPHFVERVSVGGDVTEEGEAVADTSGLRGSAPIELTYQWVRCDERCEAIEGATSARYMPLAADVGTRLRVTVVAESEDGRAASRSLLSAPVEPAVVDDAPRSAGRPQLDGLPRETETLTSTLGEWRGLTPIAKALRWQRCDATVETCVDISGATEAEYVVEAADVGKRLRTVVEAENERGGAASASLTTPPMKPEVNTAFTLDEPTALDDVADAIEGAGARVLTIDYESGNAGGYSAGDGGAAIEDVLTFFEEPWNAEGLELPVTRFSLTGSVSTEALGELAAQVDERIEAPSIHFQTRAERESAFRSGGGGTPLIDEYVSEARLWAYGADCKGDDCGPEDWEHSWPVSPIPQLPRVIETSFKWRPTTDLVERMLGEDLGFGWEFDIKLHNGENANIPFGLACLPWDSNDFWISDRNWVIVETSIPAEAGVYWDTAASDSCDEKDLTFGVYHPELLDYGTRYTTRIYLASAGDEEHSTFSWALQMLERRKAVLGADCDFSPWCVNVPPTDTVHEGRVLIERGLGYSVPGCYEYDDTMEDHAQECLFPSLQARRRSSP